MQLCLQPPFLFPLDNFVSQKEFYKECQQYLLSNLSSAVMDVEPARALSLMAAEIHLEFFLFSQFSQNPTHQYRKATTIQP